MLAFNEVCMLRTSRITDARSKMTLVLFGHYLELRSHYFAANDVHNGTGKMSS